MVAISGGTGLIGSALASRLQATGTGCILGSRQPPTQQALEMTWQKIDLADGFGLGKFLSPANQLVHLARNYQPLVDVGGSWRISYRAQQLNIEHMIFLGATAGKTTGPWQSPHLKEIGQILRGSGVPLSLIHAAPTYQWLEQYLSKQRFLFSRGLLLQPLAIGQILSALEESLSTGPLTKTRVLQGKEKLNLKVADKIFRHYQPYLQSNKQVIHAENWEDYLSQKSSSFSSDLQVSELK